MAWPFIFKLLGLGAIGVADAVKTENARVKAQSIPTTPGQQRTQFGYPEYMRPCDNKGRRLTDEEIIHCNVEGAKNMIEYCDNEIRVLTGLREKVEKNGQHSYAATLGHQIQSLKVSRQAYVRELEKWSK